MIVPKTYTILSECIEIGIEGGWNKAHKHTNKPGKDHIIQCIFDYVTNSICEKFEFNDGVPNVQVFENRTTEVGYRRNGKDIEG